MENSTGYQMTATDKIYKMLLDLPIGGLGYWTNEREPKYLLSEPGVFVIPDKWDSEKRKTFIDTVKFFIDMRYGQLYSFYLEFDKEYKKVIKRTLLFNR